MRTKLAAIVLTAGLTAAGGAALIPGSAFAADPSPSASTSATPAPTAADRAADRVTRLTGALKGLVTDGTLTQAQADKVASTLSTSDALRGEGHRGHHGGGRLNPATVAGILGITTDELRTQEQAGQTLAQIAASKSISKVDLINKLVDAGKTQLAADVTAGRLTQAQADAESSTLTAKVTKHVDEVHQGRDGHRGHGGPDQNAPDQAPNA